MAAINCGHVTSWLGWLNNGFYPLSASPAAAAAASSCSSCSYNGPTAPVTPATLGAGSASRITAFKDGQGLESARNSRVRHYIREPVRCPVSMQCPSNFDSCTSFSLNLRAWQFYDAIRYDTNTIRYDYERPKAK